MNLHVFNDVHGFTLNLTIKRFEDKKALQNNIFINLTPKTKYKNEHVLYLKSNVSSFRHFVRKTPGIKIVTFYPFDFVAAFFLRELRKTYPNVEARWVFWSYEYYHRPELYLSTLDSFSLNYYNKQNSIAGNIKRNLTILAKKILNKPVYDKSLLEESYKHITSFYSFSPADFKNIKGLTNECRYFQLSFLSVEEIIAGVESKRNMTNEIMIGHAGSITGNHVEVMEKIPAKEINNKLFVPVEYGEENYIKEIKTIAVNLFNDRVQFLENRMSKEDYFNRLSTIGFAIFNFKTQEALGNIFFLVWNGTKVFLREESSVYKQFRDWGLSVYSVDRDLNKESLSNFLSQREAEENRRIIEQIFSGAKVESYWKTLMQ